MIDEQAIIKTLESKIQYLFITRDITIFEEQKSELIAINKKIQETKNTFIKDQNENDANKFLSLENISTAILLGMIMFIKLKNNDPDGAWLQLIEAQNNAHWSINHYDLSGNLQEQYITHFNNIEKILFPPQTFQSISMISVKSKCSICDDDFTKCDHIRGEAYIGIPCTEICTEMRDFHHIAVVSNPDDKRCRCLSFGDSKEKMTNMMTLLPENEK